MTLVGRTAVTFFLAAKQMSGMVARSTGRLVLVLALAIAGGRPALAEMPAEIRAFTEENMALCKSGGGTPRLTPAYLTETELNDDGRPDYVTNLDGLECAGAWSMFCGSAGCPVTVWLSGSQGHVAAWGGYARDFTLRGKEVVVLLHGQFCTPPRVGADSCERVMRFDR
jgi:hypothetical protein